MALNLFPCFSKHGSTKITGEEIRCPHLCGYVNAFPFSLVYSNANAGMTLGDSLISTRHGTIALHLKAHSSGSDQIVKSAQSLSRTPDESVSGYKGSSRAEE